MHRFIDEIDRCGSGPQSLGNSREIPPATYHGAWGALAPKGDVIVENQAWRDYIFEYNAPVPRSPYPAFFTKLSGQVNGMMGGMMGGMGGGGLALNQLLIAMDGVDGPPSGTTFTNWINTWLDVSYLVPRRACRPKSLRLRAAEAAQGAGASSERRTSR